jgi:hypothetical protein
MRNLYWCTRYPFTTVEWSVVVYNKSPNCGKLTGGADRIIRTALRHRNVGYCKTIRASPKADQAKRLSSELEPMLGTVLSFGGSQSQTQIISEIYGPLDS